MTEGTERQGLDFGLSDEDMALPLDILKFVCLFLAILGIKLRVSYTLGHTPPLT